MMAERFETFQSFNDEQLAGLVAEKLKGNNIEFKVEKSKPLLDKGFVDTSFEQNIHIKLQPEDFEKAHQALEDFYKTQLVNVDDDYYLMTFSNEELKEILSKPDEWGYFDYQLAQKLLKDRGHEMDPRALDKLKQSRIKELAQPEEASGVFLFFGYFFIPVGIIIGFCMGHHLFFNKRALPNGQVMFSYRESDRRHGIRMMILAGILFILSIAFWAIVFVRSN